MLFVSSDILLRVLDLQGLETMAIRNREDAVEVEERVERIFGASTSGRAGEIRGLFAEVLDFEPDFGDVSLVGASGTVQLPASAERVAVLDDVYVLHVGLRH